MNFVMIDDIRDIDKYVNARPDEKLTIRTFEDGLKFVQTTNLKEITLLMDNDLDDETPGHEGYDVLKEAIEHRNYPREVVIVTSNPVARKRMINMLEAHEYAPHNSRWVHMPDVPADLRGYY